jgi:hypothetical protein
LGDREILSTMSYVNVGVLLNINEKGEITFLKHTKRVVGVAMSQTKESILLGVHRGDLTPPRATKIWKSFVESKFAYGAGMWLESSDTETLQYINKMQSIGGEQLLGISGMQEWELTNERAYANVITECGLMPAAAVSIQIQGVLRFYRIAKTRESDTMLGMMWDIVEADKELYGVQEYKKG